jgi:D-alanyl-D-alanine carboxypeptidase/D-alanyl-D-alanine-endopeptidase (penicillin-binding protein 4)
MTASTPLSPAFRWVVTVVGFSLVALVRAQTIPSDVAPATTPEALRERLEARLQDPRFAGALWSAKVVSLRTGAVWFEHESRRLMSPASNSKLYTAALALDRLGAEARLETPVLTTVPVDSAGEVKGDLVIHGRGDPDWNPRRRQEDFWKAFEPVVAVVQKAGVRRITGDIVADATWFRMRNHGAGWTADDLNDYYGAEVSALTLEENYVDLRVTPGTSAGTMARVEVLQPLSGLSFVNEIRTVPAGGKARIVVHRLAGEAEVYLSGEIAVGAKEEITEATVPRPAQWYAAALREALLRAGVRVEGQARSRRWPEPSAAALAPVMIGTVKSTPVRDQVTLIMKPSQNLRTDLLFAHLGELRRRADTPGWRTAEELAVEDLEAFLTENRLLAEDVRFEEGSGLSRNNLTSAAAVVALLEHMTRHREANAFRESLPVAGVDGTLRRRMKDTPAAGNLRAKTGTLRWAQTLSGYVTTARGEPLAFSLLLNRYRPVGSRTGATELDEVAVMLAACQIGGGAPSAAR